MPGGDGGTTKNYDSKYNERMADISETMLEWGEEAQNFYKYGVFYDPSEEVPGYINEAGEWTEGESPKDKSGVLGELGKGKPLYETVTKNRGELEGYDPSAQVSYADVESAQIAGNLEMTPFLTEQAISEASYGADRAKTEGALLDPYRKATEAGFQTSEARSRAETGLIPQQTAIRKSLMDEAERTISARSPVAEKYYKEALTGVDPEKRAARAAADVAKSYKGAASTTARQLGRYGIQPGSGAGRSAFEKTGVGFARDQAGAISRAKEGAEKESFERVKGAMAIQPPAQAY